MAKAINTGNSPLIFRKTDAFGCSLNISCNLINIVFLLHGTFVAQRKPAEEVKEDDVRYVLRRNPVRAEEMAESRLSKMRSVEGFVEKKNGYLGYHPKASASKMLEKVKEKLKSLRIDTWVQVKEEARILKIESDEEALKEENFLDGCYVIKTDLKEDAADKCVVHDRYKDLTEGERAFRDCKTVNFDVHPVHVRNEGSTRHRC
ncbi:MAG: hypothetical protein HW406_2306 [Candidatus Brocadiaceae bacterium]|nr:hypothetical protein [Candidatus Brocadiaceae bacterium]MBM2835145.1 hypothetical protein [Candidatus Brocadiaceae bacterium]